MTDLINKNKPSTWASKELKFTFFGICLTSISTLIVSIIYDQYRDIGPLFLNNFIVFSLGAVAFTGMIVTLYAMIQLCKKIISEKNNLSRSIIAATLGVLLVAFTEASIRYLWNITPNFRMEELTVYALTTNLALNASLDTFLGAAVFTAYAAYRTGRALLNHRT